MSKVREVSSRMVMAEATVSGGSGGDAGRRLDALAEISRLVTLGLDELAILRHVTEALARLLDSPYARLWTLDEDTGDLVLAATAGSLTRPAELGLRRPAVLRNLNRSILESGRLYHTTDVAADPRWTRRDLSGSIGLCTYLGMPLVVGERRYGILNLLFSGRRRLASEDRELVEVVAVQAATALANARLYQGSRRRGERLATLAELSGLVTGHLDPQAVLDAAVAATARLLEIDDVLLWLHDSASNTVRLGARAPADRQALEVVMPVGDSLVGRALRRRAPLVLDGATEHPRCSVWRADGRRPAAGLLVPFYEQRQPLGVLTALSARERAFDDEDVWLVQALAGQVAIALKNARLHQATQLQAQRLEALLDVTKRLALGPELGEILARITEEAARLLGAEAAGLRLLEGDDLVRVASSGTAGAIMRRERLPVGESLSGRVAAEGRTISSTDIADDPRYDPIHRAAAQTHGLGRWLGTPLRGRHGVLGVLFVLSSRTARSFGQDDVGLLEAFADQAAVAVDNARAFQQELERRRQLDTLRRLTGALVDTVDVEELAQRIVDAVPEAFGHDSGFVSGSIATVDQKRRRIRANATTITLHSARLSALLGRPLEQIWNSFVPPQNLQHEVVLSGEPRDGDHLAQFIAPTVPTEVADAIERLLGLRGVVAQPIVGQGRTLGVFLFGMAKAVGEVTTAERALMADFATTAGIALENVRLYAAAEELTRIDPLTGIANRRHFDRTLADEAARADRAGTSLALLLIDVDHFKAYNDAHGHQAGDAVLREVADVLGRAVRSTDFVARYGGEEFVILLPDTDADGARDVGEKVRLALAEAPMGVTISVGGGVRLARDGSVLTAAPEAALVAVADAALYAAKRAGRNRTVVL